MTEAIVIATPGAHEQATGLASALTRTGIEALAPEVAAHWSEAGWRTIVAQWPASAFVVFCITPDAAGDSVLLKMIWQLVPMSEDKTGRFIFARFDANASDDENIAPFLKRHFAVDGGDAAAIAEHANSHRQALTAAVKAQEEHRKAMEEAVLRQPPPAPRDGGPRGTGSADIGAAEPRRPMGVGAGGGPDVFKRYEDILRDAPAAPGGWKAGAPPAPSNDDLMYSRGSPPATASAPTAAPSAKLDRVDALAFAPRKLRRGTSELVRVAVFRPKDRAKATRAAKQADTRTRSASVAQTLGKIERGAIVSAILDVRGGACENSRLEAPWTGAPIDFNFPIEPSLDSAVAQALFTIRILADDAQVGTISFVRPLVTTQQGGGASNRDSREKLRRVDRVFLSYSSDDRAPVAMIASAYQRAGIQCFFDRVGLKSGEEWSPRLLTEIGRADLFHLFWSRHAAASEWVERETAYAMTKRRKSGAKRPDITIQMLDGPPWAPHPQSLDALNFDDYERAAIVGYARGDST